MERKAQRPCGVLLKPKPRRVPPSCASSAWRYPALRSHPYPFNTASSAGGTRSGAAGAGDTRMYDLCHPEDSRLDDAKDVSNLTVGSDHQAVVAGCRRVPSPRRGKAPAGFDGCTADETRHHVASVLVTKGVAPRTVAKQMGHSLQI